MHPLNKLCPLNNSSQRSHLCHMHERQHAFSHYQYMTHDHRWRSEQSLIWKAVCTWSNIALAGRQRTHSDRVNTWCCQCIIEKITCQRLGQARIVAASHASSVFHWLPTFPILTNSTKQKNVENHVKSQWSHLVTRNERDERSLIHARSSC